jgi:Zn-finger nucleic acid-binding protein
MNCPKDQSELKMEKLQDVEVDRCPTCQGIWLDYEELDTIEDRVMTDDHAKGTMMWNPTQTELRCPTCGEKMNTFDYRLEKLHIEVCPKGHGFWLDHGEEQRVVKAMEDRIAGQERSRKAESEWAGFLGKMRKKR